MLLSGINVSVSLEKSYAVSNENQWLIMLVQCLGGKSLVTPLQNSRDVQSAVKEWKQMLELLTPRRQNSAHKFKIIYVVGVICQVHNLIFMDNNKKAVR